MRLHLLLPKVNPEKITAPARCPFANCSGRRFREAAAGEQGAEKYGLSSGRSPSVSVLEVWPHPFIEQAYRYAENCYAEANATIDYLDQAIEALQEEAPEVREALTQSFIKADQLIDHCGEIVQELQQLRLKYCAVHSTSGLSPKLDLLKETRAGIEQRRKSRGRTQQ